MEQCLQDEAVTEQLANIGIESEFLAGEEYGQILNDTCTAAQDLMTDMGLI